MLQYNPRYGNSTYRALQLQYSLRMDHGDILQVAYTFSNLTSDTENTSSFLDGQGAEDYPRTTTISRLRNRGVWRTSRVIL